jgi:hypothetical protein
MTRWARRLTKADYLVIPGRGVAKGVTNEQQASEVCRGKELYPATENTGDKSLPDPVEPAPQQELQAALLRCAG